MKKLFVFLLLAGLVGGGVAYFLYNKPHEDISTLTPDYVIFPSTLANAFDENEDEANALYLDKTIELKGKVREIAEDGSVRSLVLETGNPITGVLCEFQDQEMIANIKAGDSVTVRGICSGKLTDVVLVRCILM
jgi:hypothetical protein